MTFTRSDEQISKQGSEARRSAVARELKRKWPSVKVEEDVGTKVKRWKQVLQARPLSAMSSSKMTFLTISKIDSFVWGEMA